MALILKKMKTRIKLIPRLTVIGAGLGNPRFITDQGISALASANVILYDSLVNPELLNFTKESTIKIDVGKRNGKPAYTQDQINSLIVDFAFAYGHVVRLKGSSLFLNETSNTEITAADEFNIETEIIPVQPGNWSYSLS